MGRFGGKKERKTISQVFGALRQRTERAVCFPVCVMQRDWWICKTPISLIQLLRIQSGFVKQRHTSLYIYRRKEDLRQIEHLWGQEKGVNGCVWCGELQLHLESASHERNAVSPEIYHILLEWCPQMLGKMGQKGLTDMIVW